MSPTMTELRSRFVRSAAGVLLIAAAVFGSSASAQNAEPAADGSHIIRISSSTAAAPHHLSLALNKAAIIELDRDARDVFVANPQIADAVVRTPRRIFIMSLKMGQTNVILLDAQGRQIAAVEIVVGADVSDLNEQIARRLPDGKVQARALNDNVVLSGNVTSARDASEAQAMAQRFTGSPDKVVNNLSIDQRQQVLIQVRVSEMNRTISKQLGLNTTVAANVAGVPVAFTTDNQFSLLGRALANLSGAQIGQAPSPNNISVQLKALERIGLVHTLAEPNLTAISGEAAKFLAGGEFPVPVGRDQFGNIIIQYKQFGIGLAFTPVVLSKGRISLQVSTEVSELTNIGALKLADLTLPGLSVRRAETTVEMPSGGALAIGGLIQQQTKQNLDAFPGVKDLPVLGALFRSRDFQNNESELVVTVTAYLVNPVSPTQIAHPDDGYAVPTDLETILLGRVNAVYGKDAKVPEIPKNSVGYIVQ